MSELHPVKGPRDRDTQVCEHTQPWLLNAIPSKKQNRKFPVLLERTADSKDGAEEVHGQPETPCITIK